MTFGWLVHTKTHAVMDDRDEPTTWLIEEATVEVPGRDPTTVRIYAREGAVGINEPTETGEPFFVPLERIKTERRENLGSSYRFYNVHRLPDSYGGGELRLRLMTNQEDRDRGLNRAEHLRAIPPSDPDFHRLFRRRVDAESLNRGLEDTLYWKRAHSVGAQAQEADLLGFAIGLNALSWHRHRKRRALAEAA